MSDHERYKLTCHGCGRALEIPAGKANEPETRTCPHCGAKLELHWRAEHGRQ